jgi:hypothetical protein
MCSGPWKTRFLVCEVPRSLPSPLSTGVTCRGDAWESRAFLVPWAGSKPSGASLGLRRARLGECPADDQSTES